MTIVTRIALVVCVLAGTAACATTSFKSTWKSPEAQPVTLNGQKVAAFVLTKNTVSRRAAEDALAREITAGGGQGIPGYTLVADDVDDEARAKAALEKAGVLGVVVMRPVDTSREVVATTTYAGPYYRPYWGGYYRYGWGSAWGAPAVDVRTNTIVTVETLVYSIPQNMLIWAGQSDTTNPSKVDAFVRELATAARREMQKAGLLK
jgi:hypothetical protein